MTRDTLTALAALIKSRRVEAADRSYTRQLLDGGAPKCARKFGEEAIELTIAAVGSPASEVTSEAADVLYHLLVLLEARDVPLEAVLSALESRMGTSGLEEKAARPKP